jgi:hypothetical protein
VIDLPTRIAGWIGGLLLVAAAFGGTYLTGRLHGRDAERAVWTERQIIAERAARQTETDLAGIADASAKRIAEKERLLNDQAQRQSAAWRAALARVRDQRVPAAVGVQLNAAAGVPGTPSVAGTPAAGPDAGDLDPLIGLAETLDACRQNNLAGRTNADRLTEARDWYEALRARVNRQ